MAADNQRDPHRLRLAFSELPGSIIAAVNKEEFNSVMQLISTNWVDPLLQSSLEVTKDDLCNMIKMDKIHELIELEKSATSNSPAWRPTPGTVDITPFKIKALLKKKNRLQKQIQDENDEIAQLEVSLTHSKNAVEWLVEKMAAVNKEN